MAELKTDLKKETISMWADSGTQAEKKEKLFPASDQQLTEATISELRNKFSSSYPSSKFSLKVMFPNKLGLGLEIWSRSVPRTAAQI